LVEYNKSITGKGMPKDRPYPFRSGGGPRDQQRRIQTIQQLSASDKISSDALVEELRNQIRILSQELIKPKIEGQFTAEEVDEEIRKAVLSAVKDTESKLKDKINKLTTINTELKKEIDRLKVIIEEKQTEDVNILTKKVEELSMIINLSRGENVSIDPDRPKMEEIFIDPLSKDAGKDLESHVNIKDSSSKDKVKVEFQVDKLKGLIGKLPSMKK
jgi:hypothetical protein